MAASKQEVVFPNQIPVDPDKNTRAVFVHADQGLFAPQGLVESFRRADAAYTSDRGARFRFMADSVMSVPEIGLDASFVHTERDAQSREILIVLSPLNDGRPESDPPVITDFVTKPEVTKADVRHAKPNSHRPAAKLDMDYEFGHAEGLGMPRLQVFAPEAPAMTSAQRRRVAGGDMTPYGELAMTALQKAERIMHRTYGHEGFDTVHFFTAGMGAKGLGAAVHMLENSNKQIGSTTLMNFALGEQTLAKMAADYSGRRMVGEPSELILPDNYRRVAEMTVLRELDRDGAEFAMRLRQIRALWHVRMVRSIMNASMGVKYVDRLLDNGSTVTVANGANEALVAQTYHYLPVGDGNLYRTDIVGVDGKKVGQIVNEHGAALALVSNLGLANHKRRRPSPGDASSQ